jgi:hypothetical protein
MPANAAWVERYLWIDEGVSYRRAEAHSGWPSDVPQDTARIVLPNDQPFPGIGMREPFADWQGYQAFAFDIYNPSDKPLALGLRIEDFHHNDQYYDRFNRALSIEPGFHTVRIPLAEIERGPRERRLFLSRMNGFKLFAIRPMAPLEFYLGNVRLE